MHSTRILRVGEEYIEAQTLHDGSAKEIAVKPINEIEEVVETTADMKADNDEEDVKRLTRKSAIRRPQKNRTVRFKRNDSIDWITGEVKSVGQNVGTDQFKCKILLESQDVMEIDFSNKNYVWEYVQEKCDLCASGFDNRKGLKRHKQIKHRGDKSTEVTSCDQCGKELNSTHELQKHVDKVHGAEKPLNGDAQKEVGGKMVTFNEEQINYNEEDADNRCEVCKHICENASDLTAHILGKHEENSERVKHIKKLKIRFKEVTDEHENNTKWIETKNAINEEEIKYAEIQENDDNFEKCKIAKESELSNFDDYEAFIEVDDDGQEVLGT